MPSDFLMYEGFVIFVVQVELLEFNGEVLLSATETNTLLLKLQNLFTSSGNDEVDWSNKSSSKSVQSVRLALACNLGRSILKE
jgi:hypothetical protein